MNDRETIWAVTYYDEGNDPVVTVFNNKEACVKCYEFFLGKHDKVNFDKCQLYSKFEVF